MNVEILSFHLKPWGFFSQSPTIDLPPSCNAASRNHDQAGKKGAPAAIAAGGACCAKPTAATLAASPASAAPAAASQPRSRL